MGWFGDGLEKWKWEVGSGFCFLVSGEEESWKGDLDL